VTRLGLVRAGARVGSTMTTTRFTAPPHAQPWRRAMRSRGADVARGRPQVSRETPQKARADALGCPDGGATDPTGAPGSRAQTTSRDAAVARVAAPKRPGLLARASGGTEEPGGRGCAGRGTETPGPLRRWVATMPAPPPRSPKSQRRRWPPRSRGRRAASGRSSLAAVAERVNPAVHVGLCAGMRSRFRGETPTLAATARALAGARRRRIARIGRAFKSGRCFT
jgi:hypothetical protein